MTIFLSQSGTQEENYCKFKFSRAKANRWHVRAVAAGLPFQRGSSGLLQEGMPAKKRAPALRPVYGSHSYLGLGIVSWESPSPRDGRETKTKLRNESLLLL